MAERSVFISKQNYPFFEEVLISFDWFGGFALSQKRKCQISLHQNFNASYPERKVLEISSSSLISLGARLSAMNLSKRTERGITSVESAFQSSRIYSDSTRKVGPFPEYTFLPGKECKANVKKQSLGMHSYNYYFDGMSFSAPEYHISLFYDFLYLNALLEPENESVKNELLDGGYTAFSDLATKALNSQARSAAIFVGLVHANRIDEVKSYPSYLKLFRTCEDGETPCNGAYENVQLLNKNTVMLLSPVVPCRFGKEAVERYYLEHCSVLSNRKESDNYLDLKMGFEDKHRRLQSAYTPS